VDREHVVATSNLPLLSTCSNRAVEQCRVADSNVDPDGGVQAVLEATRERPKDRVEGCLTAKRA
jgi:hypothetical protein